MNHELRKDDLHYVWHPFQQVASYADRQLIVVGGEGPYLIGDDGTRYLDAISGLWNLNLGYSEQRIVKAVCEQLQRMPFTSLIVFSHEPSIHLARSLAERAPGSLDAVFFTSGGSEGVETAMKLARHVAYVRGEPMRQKIIALRGAYHGMTYGALSVTGIPQDRWQFGTLLPNIIHVSSPYSFLSVSDEFSQDSVLDACVTEVERALEFHDSKTVAALIVEPVMGAGGMIPHPANYLQRLRTLCDDAGIFLIFDEVVTGFGRTGKLFAAEQFGVIPDMLILAKGISAGYIPLGAVLVSRSIFDLCQSEPSSNLMHGFTFGGSPAGCVASLTCLEIIESEGLLEKVEKDGIFLLSEFKKAFADNPFVKNIRGIGLMLALDLVDPYQKSKLPSPAFGARVMQLARESGVIIRTTYGGYTFNFAPPFICSREELIRIVETVKMAIEKASKEQFMTG